MFAKAVEIDHLVRIAAGLVVTECETALGWIGRTDTSKVQVQPVFAVERSRSLVQLFRGMCQQMCQLRALLTGVEASSCAREPCGVACVLAQSFCGRSCTGIKPKPRITDRLSVLINKPCAIPLPSHGNSNNAARHIRNALAQLAQGPRAVIPSLIQWLRRGTTFAGRVAIRNSGGCDLPAAQIKCNGFDDGSACINAYDQILAHPTNRAPWLIAMPVCGLNI